MSGRCEKHDNWHAHCQRCCAEAALKFGDVVSALAGYRETDEAADDAVVRLRAELAAAESLVDALNTQRGVDAEASLRAVAEKAEEVREACAQRFAHLKDPPPPGTVTLVDYVRATPLDATPLRERIAELEADRVKLRSSIVALCEQSAAGALDRAERAEARVKELERSESIAVLRASDLITERDALKAELAERSRTAQRHFLAAGDLKAQVERLTDAVTQLRRPCQLHGCACGSESPDVLEALKEMKP